MVKFYLYLDYGEILILYFKLNRNVINNLIS